MDIAKELSESKQLRDQKLALISELKQQEQILVQDILRLDGAINMLERLSKDSNKPEKPEKAPER